MRLSASLFATISRLSRSPLTGKQRLALIGASAFLLVALGRAAAAAPAEFPEDQVAVVRSGQTLDEVVEGLAEQRVVRSSFLLRLAVTYYGGDRGAVAGHYYFAEKPTVWEVGRRLTKGKEKLDKWQVTIPEGWNIHQMAETLDKTLPDFSTRRFLAAAEEHQGYLFPDTYKFSPQITEQEIVERMTENFQEQLAPWREEVEQFGRSLQEIVIMASILEAEGQSTEDRRRIAGVLWRRLQEGMPLQVDASFLQVNQKTTYELTLADLEIDHPFNTYRYSGLPPTPITNPGLDSLRAAVSPIESDHLYYLSERDGTTHFSETLEEHKQKKHKYLSGDKAESRF